MRTQFLAATLLIAAHASAADGGFTGVARHLETGEILYLESHAIADAGTPRETRIVTYACPDGAPFARKRLTYGAARIAPSFRLDDARSGVIEGLSRDASGLEVFSRAGPDAALRTARVTRGELIADAGFDEFVRTRWEALERGGAIDAPFLVPSRLETMAFRIRKVGESQIEGEVVSDIRLSLAGMLGWLVPDIDVSYRKSDRRLMRYRGTTNLRDAAGKMIEARIDFPASHEIDGVANLDASRDLPLVTSCAPR
jgi:hypothetical protein